MREQLPPLTRAEYCEHVANVASFLIFLYEDKGNMLYGGKRLANVIASAERLCSMDQGDFVTVVHGTGEV